MKTISTLRPSISRAKLMTTELVSIHVKDSDRSPYSQQIMM